MPTAELSSGAFFVHGHDVHGRSVLTVRNGRHLTSTTWYDKPRLYATCVWLVEQAAAAVVVAVAVVAVVILYVARYVVSVRAHCCCRHQAIHQSRDATGRFVLLVDLRGFAMRNFDPYLVEHAFTIIFKHYPDAMAACYLL